MADKKIPTAIVKNVNVMMENGSPLASIASFQRMIVKIANPINTINTTAARIPLPTDNSAIILFPYY